MTPPSNFTAPGLLADGMASGFRHALKNSLGSLGLALRAVSRAADALPPSTSSIVEAARRELVLTQVMTDRFLELLRPLAFDLQAIRVSDLLGSAIAASEAKTGQRGPAVPDLAPEFEIAGDRVQLTAALAAILTNALEAGASSVEVIAEPVAGDRALIEVHDNGSGIPPRIARNATAPFVTSRQGRSGLGLAMAKRTIEAHGGTIELMASDPGTIVVVRLPVSGPSPMPSA